jgi:hypothetical protein
MVLPLTPFKLLNTLNFKGIMRLSFFLMLIENIVFVVARFAVFPYEGYLLVMDLLGPFPIAAYAVGAGIALMFVFNFVLVALKFGKVKKGNSQIALFIFRF